MTQVVTEAQARQITGGRKPLVPVEYEDACKALERCIDLPEAKYWADKSDALAAWAKIYHDDKIGRDAKRLKLKAYRRMGEIAAELRPLRKNVKGRSGFVLGPSSVLKEFGIPEIEGRYMRRMALVDKQVFDEAVEKAKSPATTYRHLLMKHKTSAAWISMSKGAGVLNCRAWTKLHPAKEIAVGLSPDEIIRTRAMIVELTEWLDELEQYLPK